MIPLLIPVLVGLIAAPFLAPGQSAIRTWLEILAALVTMVGAAAAVLVGAAMR